MQVYRQAGNFTLSFIDYQHLSKLMPASSQVSEQLQQAAHLCLDSQYQARQVCHKGIRCEVLHVCSCEKSELINSSGVPSCCAVYKTVL